MHAILKKIYAADTLKPDPLTINGRAVDELSNTIEIIDSVFKTSTKGCADRFEYLGFKLTDDVDEYRLRAKGGVDIDRTDIRYAELFFKFDGQEFSTYTAPPFVRQAGVFTLSGTKYGVLPVLSDGVITPGPDFVFVKVLGIKFFLKSIPRQHMKNGEKVLTNITYSESLASTTELEDEKTIGNIVSPVMNFYVGKYGFKETMRRFGVEDFKVEFGTSNYTKYAKDYNLYSSTGKPPREVKGGDLLNPHNVVFYINKKQDSPIVEKTIASILYSFDIFPSNAMFIAEYILEGAENDERGEWLKLIGRLSYRDRYSVGKSTILTQKRFVQMEGYLDSDSKRKLEMVGRENIHDFFDLLKEITEDYEDLIVSYKQHKSIKDFSRFLETGNYFMYIFIYNINRLIHEINAHVNNRKPNVDLIKKTVTGKINTKTIFGINSNKGVNLTLLPLDSTTDSMFTTCTGRIELQERGNGVLKAPKSAFPRSTRSLKAIDYVIGTVPHLRKKAATPMLNVNPYTKWDRQTGKLILTDDDIYVLEALQLLLSGRIIDDELAEQVQVDDDDLSKDSVEA